MNLTMQEVFTLLGEKDVQIFQLLKALNEAQAELAKLKAAPAAQPQEGERWPSSGS